MPGRNSLTDSFAGIELKTKMLRDYESAVSAFEKKYGAGDWRSALSQVKPLISGYATRKWRMQ